MSMRLRNVEATKSMLFKKLQKIYSREFKMKNFAYPLNYILWGA